MQTIIKKILQQLSDRRYHRALEWEAQTNLDLNPLENRLDIMQNDLARGISVDKRTMCAVIRRQGRLRRQLAACKRIIRQQAERQKPSWWAAWEALMFETHLWCSWVRIHSIVQEWYEEYRYTADLEEQSVLAQDLEDNGLRIQALDAESEDLDRGGLDKRGREIAQRYLREEREQLEMRLQKIAARIANHRRWHSQTSRP